MFCHIKRSSVHFSVVLVCFFYVNGFSILLAFDSQRRLFLCYSESHMLLGSWIKTTCCVVLQLLTWKAFFVQKWSKAHSTLHIWRGSGGVKIKWSKQDNMDDLRKCSPWIKPSFKIKSWNLVGCCFFVVISLLSINSCSLCFDMWRGASLIDMYGTRESG